MHRLMLRSLRKGIFVRNRIMLNTCLSLTAETIMRDLSRTTKFSVLVLLAVSFILALPSPNLPLVPSAYANAPNVPVVGSALLGGPAWTWTGSTQPCFQSVDGTPRLTLSISGGNCTIQCPSTITSFVTTVQDSLTPPPVNIITFSCEPGLSTPSSFCRGTSTVFTTSSSWRYSLQNTGGFSANGVCIIIPTCDPSIGLVTCFCQNNPSFCPFTLPPIPLPPPPPCSGPSINTSFDSNTHNLLGLIQFGSDCCPTFCPIQIAPVSPDTEKWIIPQWVSSTGLISNEGPILLSPPPSVGGQLVRINKLSVIWPFIGLAAIGAGALSVIVYVGRFKRRNSRKSLRTSEDP
jgi:hypothetical protein